MSRIFITYRRLDSSSETGRIADRLQTHFGQDSVFYDITTIPLGIDFPTFINSQLNTTEIFLVVIGDNWLDLKDADGNRRIDDPNDWVRIEVAAALARDALPVIPVMVGEASNPPPKELLPEDIATIADRNGMLLRSDSTFEGQIKRLINYIADYFDENSKHEATKDKQLLVGKNADEVLMRTKRLDVKDMHSIRFSLSTAHDVTWWKAIKVIDKRGTVSRLITEDDVHGPILSPCIPISQFGEEVIIEFHKAKTFGVPVHVETMKFPTTHLKGADVSFIWLTD